MLSLNPGEVDPGLQELVTTQSTGVKPVIYNNNNNSSNNSDDKEDVVIVFRLAVDLIRVIMSYVIM